MHYAQHILQKTTYKKVFAFGNAGDSKHHTLQPLFVDKNGYKWLPEVQTFENFSMAHIVEYYKRLVLEETPPEDIELADILKKAKELHEYLRNYGGLGEQEIHWRATRTVLFCINILKKIYNVQKLPQK